MCDTSVCEHLCDRPEQAVQHVFQRQQTGMPYNTPHQVHGCSQCCHPSQAARRLLTRVQQASCAMATNMMRNEALPKAFIRSPLTGYVQCRTRHNIVYLISVQRSLTCRGRYASVSRVECCTCFGRLLESRCLRRPCMLTSYCVM